jgi:hypothetical protein
MNPYNFLIPRHDALLDTVVDNLPAQPTFDNLNEILTAAIVVPDPADPFISNLGVMVTTTLLPNAYNGYMHRGTRSNMVYTELQQQLVLQLTQGLLAVPPQAMSAYLEQVEENILRAGLCYREQAPLLVAVALARGSAKYWLTRVQSPGPWAAWLPANEALAYGQVNGIVEAGVQGALLLYGLLQPPQLMPADVYSSFIGAAGLEAGKVVFGWVPVAGG